MLAAIYNLTLIVGTAYLVDQRGWSMWTFLLCMLLMVSTRKKKESE